MISFPIIGTVIFVIILVALVIYKSSERYKSDPQNIYSECAYYIENGDYVDNILDTKKAVDKINTYITILNEPIKNNIGKPEEVFFKRKRYNLEKCIVYFNKDPIIHNPQKVGFGVYT